MARLVTNFDLCTGCKTCELVCSLRKMGGFNPNKALLYLQEELEGFGTQPVVCAQCQNPFCQQACPTGAIQRNQDTGALKIDGETCIGCGLCAENCPLGVIQKNGDIYMKCDLCGGDPLCVEKCPTGAIKLIDMLAKKEVDSI